MNMYESRKLVIGHEDQYDFLHGLFINKKFIDIIHYDDEYSRLCKRAKIFEVKPIFHGSADIIGYKLNLVEYINAKSRYHTRTDMCARIFSDSVHSIIKDSISLIIVKHDISVEWSNDLL